MIYKTHRTETAKLTTAAELIQAWAEAESHRTWEEASSRKSGRKVPARTRASAASWTSALRLRERCLVDSLSNAAWAAFQIAAELAASATTEEASQAAAAAQAAAQVQMNLADAIFGHVYQAAPYSTSIAAAAAAEVNRAKRSA